MTYLQFVAPPLPHFINCGETVFEPGKYHLSRNQIGVFDFIYVTEGALYMGEDQQKWIVKPGESIILRPDRYHYSFQKCDTRTHFYWIHFQTTGSWDESFPKSENKQRVLTKFQPISHFFIYLPRYGRFVDQTKALTFSRQLLALESQYSSSNQWKQQTIFQNLLEELTNVQDQPDDPSIKKVAEAAAAYLRLHYTDHVAYTMLGEHLHFHPVYISRCMKRIYGCTPLTYITRYRVEQSKLLLMNTNRPVQQIAFEVGFNSVTYYIRCFSKFEGLTPKTYRQKFRIDHLEK